ncbi:hypothetical protein EOE18_02295 [Novosphingobium umbonatum]|uniref:Calcium-binding protein n=1 Tax=Novosphingobium umbonatum TaxID=1908524 RepID=A0A437NDN8_9SPHN|nr:hypothetical protein [Novosphingobium umbonatum]RVU07922.1 hypothetical protein EOE18_02295 [Novosphingobium umbonatum]
MTDPLSAKTFVGGTSGNDDLRANSQDTDGSYLFARGGDDILRGGKYDDVLTGGAGSDQYYGGAGADQFRFFGYDVTTGDRDRVYDLNFSDGDTIVFGSFATDTFADAAGINAYTNGTAATISSFEGLANMVNDADAVWATRKGTTDLLILHVTVGTETQTIEISNAYSAYVAAGGLIG